LFATSQVSMHRSTRSSTWSRLLHKPLVVAPELLAILCISESYLPSSFIDDVGIIMPELVLRDFIVCLNTRGDHGDFWGRNSFDPIHQKERCLPHGPLEDVSLAHSAHRRSLFQFAPCFFKK
jgi:hypothetical protein